MSDKRIIASIEDLPDDIVYYLNKNYKFYDLSPYLKNYKTIKNYEIDNREQWNKSIKDIFLNIKDFESPDLVIFRTYTILDKNLIDIFPSNILFLRAGSGYDNIDIKYALSRGCFVENTPMANTNSAFEHTIALLFAALKNLLQFDQSTKNGNWRDNIGLNIEAKGKSICIAGYGNIGSKVASLAEFLGMNIYIYDPVKSLIGYFNETFKLKDNLKITEFRYNDFDYNPLYEIVKEVDIISFHVPLYDKTYKIINEKFLSFLKERSILINTSRGELFDQEATFSYYKNNPRSILATDVLPKEPGLKENPLFNLPNCIITPHIGAYTKEARIRLKEEVIKCIESYFNEKRILYPVNPDFYFSPYFKY
ncbi:MAG: NAD(P)-dependent oxidoreductase [Exilispira sp.]